jgi:hypothetical protein
MRAELQKAPSNVMATEQLLKTPQIKVSPASIPERYKVTDPITGQRRPFRDYSIPAGLAREVELSVQPKEMHAFWKHIQGITRPFKKYVTSTTLLGAARPAFFVRNLIDLGFRGTLGLGMRFWTDLKDNWSDAARLISGQKGELIIDGYKMPYKEIREILVSEDLMRKGFEKIGPRGRGIVETAVSKISEGAAHSIRHHKNEFHRWLDQMPVLKYAGPERLGEAMESMPVITGLIGQLRAGVPMRQALDTLKTTFFSFNNLTPFEQSVMRSAFPFYSFTRQAIPFLSFQAAKRPALLTALPKISSMDDLTKEEEAAIPEWIKDFPHVSVRRTDKGFQLMSMRNVFTVDVLPDLLPNLSGEGFKKFISQMNPIVTTPIEWIIGKDLYLGRGTRGERKRLWRGLESEAMRTHHWLTKTWFSRLFRELDQSASLLEGKLSKSELSGLLTGFKLYEIDMDRQRRVLMAESERITRKYKAALKRGDDVEANDILEEYRLK